MRIQVLPLAGSHPIGTGAFALLHFAPVPGISQSTDVVYIEQLGRTALYVEDEDEVFDYRLALTRTTERSLSPDETRELIAKVAREDWS